MEDIVPIASILTILGAPHLPSLGVGYGFVEHIATRLFLIGAVIYAIRLGPMSGLLAFLAAFTLLIERNHEVLTTFPNQELQAKVPSASYGLPIQAPSLIPEKDTYLFESTDEQGKEVVETRGETTTTKEYETTEDIEDSNTRIESVPGSYNESPGFFERLAK
jgi:hypothetical protein